MNTRMNRADVLEALGFAAPRRSRNDMRTMLPAAIGLFGAGMLVGAGIALAMAPKPGRELRQDVVRNAGNLGQTIRQRIPSRNRSAEGHGEGHEHDIHASATQPRTRS